MDPKAAIVAEIVKLVTATRTKIEPHYKMSPELHGVEPSLSLLDLILREELVDGKPTNPNRFYGRLSSASDCLTMALRHRDFTRMEEYVSKDVYRACGLAQSLQYLP